MNKISNYISSLIIMCVFAVSFGQAVNAQVVTFAQFLQQTGGQDFVFTNNSGTSGDFTTTSGGSAINFFYQNISGLPAELQGLQSAHVTVTSTTTSPATGSGQLVQPLDSVTTIAMIRDTAATVGTGTRRNLLTVTINTSSAVPGISGGVGGNSATLNASTPGNTVTFTSDFLGFGLTTQRAGGLSFSSVTPSYAQGAGGFLANFTAAGTGTFSSDPPPIYNIPTAASASVSGKVTNMYGRGVSRAVVQMLDVSGNVRYVTTNSFGYFKFNEVEVGETYVFSVEAKGYSFAPQVINVAESIRDLEFTQSFF